MEFRVYCLLVFISLFCDALLTGQDEFHDVRLHIVSHAGLLCEACCGHWAQEGSWRPRRCGHQPLMGPGTIRCLAHSAWPMLWVRQCALSPYPLADCLSSRSVHGARRCDSGGRYQDLEFLYSPSAAQVALMCTPCRRQSPKRVSRNHMAYPKGTNPGHIIYKKKNKKKLVLPGVASAAGAQ